MIELFAGIGSQRKALYNIQANHRIVGISEIDKEALVSYASIHCDLAGILPYFVFPDREFMFDHLIKKGVGFNFLANRQTITKRTKLNKLKVFYLADILTGNLGDITKIHGSKLPTCNLMTYSFPCTDISNAGKQKGFKKGSKTRSGLLWEVERLLNQSTSLPEVLLMENVSMILADQFVGSFGEWLNFLESIGYKNYFRIVNAKDHGIPQSRLRCFMVSVLGNYSYVFPQGRNLNHYLNDFLISNDNEKLYIDNELSRYVIEKEKHLNYTRRNRIVCLNLRMNGKRVAQWNRILHDEFLCSTLVTIEPAKVYVSALDRVRYLSAVECMLLMGFDKTDYELAHKYVLDSHIYHQTGNSIVVPVLEDIFKSIFNIN